MSPSPPYTYFSCPCVNTSVPLSQQISSPDDQQDEDGEQDPTFSPHSLRANYSLYPLDHLLYCEDCHEIRCPRCVIDEIVNWFCPSCLFEVASSQIKSEGNRCTRSCYNCPSCTAPLSVTPIAMPEVKEGETNNPWEGTYVMNCQYCNWCSTELGIKFHKPNDISGQLANLRKSGTTRSGEPASPREVQGATSTRLDREQHFKNIRQFHSSQLAQEASSSTTSGMDLASAYGSYGSPGTLSRIMSLYTGVGSYAASAGRDKSRKKIRPIREASGAEEGVRVLGNEEETTIQKMKEAGWEGASNQSQRTDLNVYARFLSDLYPSPTLLRTKRAKRCRTCRHILVKPEPKVQSTRFRIRLVAMNYIPRLSISPLPLSTNTTPFAPPAPSPFPPKPTQIITLQPLQATQFLLSFTNPLFTPLAITLASPPFTSRGTKTTVLTPQFTVGASKDVWDEALSSSSTTTAAAAGPTTLEEKRRTRLAAAGGTAGGVEAAPYARGRNWTSIIVELVPGSAEEEGGAVEIPVFVRIEHESESTVAGEKGKAEAAKGQGEGDGEGDGAEKREDSFWCVLGVGTVKAAS